MNTERRIADFFKGFGNEWRIRIVSLLLKEPLSVKDISQSLKKSQVFVSNHLRILKNIGLLDYIAEGRFHKYFIKKEHIDEMLDQIKQQIFRGFEKDKS